jgi:hypothetical protein
VRFRHVILDFDGSCTRVQDAAARYLAEYRRLFGQEVDARAADDWDAAVAVVRARSPEAGWMLGGTPSAPAAADPYILAGEAAGYLIRQRRIECALPADLHSRAYAAARAPFREDLLEVLDGLVALGLRVHFVSNTGTRTIEQRLDELLADHGALRRRIEVIGDAAKFRIRELSDDGFAAPESLTRLFAAVPAAAAVQGLRRPMYLRRGAYFEALCKAWHDEPSAITETLVCGDIWELDLALPAALGTAVHLITRVSPYDTYEYELRAARDLGARAGISDDLRGLLVRVRDGTPT